MLTMQDTLTTKPPPSEAIRMREENLENRPNTIRFVCAVCSEDLTIVSLGLSKTWQVRIEKCDCEEE